MDLVKLCGVCLLQNFAILQTIVPVTPKYDDNGVSWLKTYYGQKA
jgi:hypothetical protein